MQVVIIPNDSGRVCRTCLSSRDTWVLGIFLFLVLPIVVGAMTWYLAEKLIAGENSSHNYSNTYAARQITEQKKRILNLQQNIIDIQRRSEAGLDALSLHLGRLQAESMRTNALGQRLAEMAGIDNGEFDFSAEPAVGSTNTDETGQHLDMIDLKDHINRVAAKLDQERMELSLLENIMLDKELKQSMDPKGWPVKRGYISSSYGYRSDPFTGKKVFHKGVDIPSPDGSPIYALAAGVVNYAGSKKGLGNMVEIDHGNGYTTLYAHISKLAVKTGDRVDQEQVIAHIGSTGRSTGPHLHLEMFKDGRRFNPRKRLHSARKAKDN